MLNYYYIISMHNVDLYDIIFADLNKTDYAVFIDDKVKLKFVLCAIKRLFCHDCFPHLKKIFDAIVLDVYFKWLMRNVPKGKRKYCFITPSRYLLMDGDKYIREHYPESKMVCFCTDLLANHHADEVLLKNREKVDLFYSYDPLEAAKYNMLFRNLPCSEIAHLTEGVEVQYDLTFVGKDKGRLALIKHICREMTKRGLVCNFHLIKIPVAQREQIKGIYYHDNYLSYKECLKISASGRCILEIIQPNSSGNTIRVAESILLRRKLLSNNCNILTNQYYIADNMMYFNDIGDVPSAFFKRDCCEVSEEFRNNITPAAFIQSIDNDLSERFINHEGRI